MSAAAEHSGAVAVVTGGAGGIGRGVIEALQARGARVASLDLAQNPAATLSILCDLTDRDAVEAAVARVVDELGAPELLVSASGIVRELPFDELEPDQWHAVIGASLTAAYLACRAVLPHMVELGRGSIVTMSSGWGRKGYPHGSDYAAAKSGIEGLTKSLALEYASRGIRVNAIAPGPVLTAMVTENPNFDPKRVAAIPMGRIGEVPDVVDPILFFLGQQSRYVTGQVLHVNGGLLMP